MKYYYIEELGNKLTTFLPNIMDLLDKKTPDLHAVELDILCSLGNRNLKFFRNDQLQRLHKKLKELIENPDLQHLCLMTLRWMIKSDINYFNNVVFSRPLGNPDEKVLYALLDLFAEVLQRGGFIDIWTSELENIIRNKIEDESSEERVNNLIFTKLIPIVDQTQNKDFLNKLFKIICDYYLEYPQKNSEELLELITRFGLRKIEFPEEFEKNLDNLRKNNLKSISFQTKALESYNAVKYGIAPQKSTEIEEGNLITFTAGKGTASLTITSQATLEEKEIEKLFRKEYGFISSENPPFLSIVEPKKIETGEVEPEFKIEGEKLFAEIQSGLKKMYYREFLKPLNLSPDGSSFIKIENDSLQKINQNIEKITKLINDGQTGLITDFENFGKLMASIILKELNETIKNYTENVNLSLILSENLLEFPLEIMHDGEAYLGLKFGCGRIIKSVNSKINPPELKPREKLTVLIIGNPTGDLPGAQKEAETLVEFFLEKNIEVKPLLGPDATYDNVIGALMAGYDFIHYTGHAVFNTVEPDESELILKDKHLKAHEITSYPITPLLAFFNACSTSKTEGWETKKNYVNQVFGLAQAFVTKGIYFIGTLWPVSDDAAVVVAREFYNRIISNGESFGKALQGAKQTAFDKYGEDTIAWASYILYGDPSLTIEYPKRMKSCIKCGIRIPIESKYCKECGCSQEEN